jgi:hypothetical protein
MGGRFNDYRCRLRRQPTVDTAFLMGCALGDGCLSRDKRWGTVTLHVQRCMRQAPYAAWQLERLNQELGSKATIKTFADKGKYPAVRFGVSSKEKLGPVYDTLYPDGVKRFCPQVFRGLGAEALSLFWMDDGSLEVRKRQRPRSIKIERSGWLALSHNEDEVKAVADWIYDITGASGSVVRHRTGMLYLRWFSKQFRLLVEAISDHVHPCLAYKVDLNRTGTVAEWLSESQLPEWKMDDKAARVPRTLAKSIAGDDIV